MTIDFGFNQIIDTAILIPGAIPSGQQPRAGKVFVLATDQQHLDATAPLYSA